eukprot:706411_1
MAQLMEHRQCELISFLTIANKGWNRLLFIDSNDDLSPFQCKTCFNICRDPSVIDDQMHCYPCLTGIIQRNNDKCPVNGHTNPTIRRIKPILKVIHSKTVLCPLSTYFKRRINDQNDVMQHVEETQREGVINEANNAQYVCHWKGTLHMLITEHLPQCINANDPTFTAKPEVENSSLEIENKSLKMENEALRMENESLKQKLLDEALELNRPLNAVNVEERKENESGLGRSVEDCHTVYDVRDQTYLSKSTSDWIQQVKLVNEQLLGEESLFEFVPCTNDNCCR